MASSQYLDLEKKAKEAFVDDNFELAVDLYSQALDMDPKNADLLADRAQANIKLKNFTEAVADANKAIMLNSSLIKAYLRKGTACMQLEEYQTAKAALETGASLSPGDTRFANLIRKCDVHIAEESNELQQPDEEIAKKRTSGESKSGFAIDATKGVGDGQDMLHEGASKSSKRNYRHAFFQTPDEVVVSLYAKGVPEKNVTIDFGEQTLSVEICIPGEEAYSFQPRLFGKIIPEKCKYIVLGTKVEIRLAKAEANNWPCLEFKKDAVPQKIIVSSGTQTQRPTYPSSKSKKVDWDKLESQVKKEEKEEKLDGDAALNKLFRDIYQDADEDTRRAMEKSFVESSGTVLSTNWKEVGSTRVAGSPPDGMEMKKW